MSRMRFFKQNTDHLILAVYLAGFLVAAVCLAVIQPLENMPPAYPNPPDEHARFLIPEFIRDHGRLPTGFEKAVEVPGGLGGSYAFQPILPYIVMGYLMRMLGAFGASEGTMLVSARLVNVASGLCMAITLYALAGRLFQKRAYRWLFCFGIMYLPQQLFLHTYVNTESMCMLSVALIIHALVCLYRDGPDKRNGFLLALGMTLCLQTYYNAYGFVLAAVFLGVTYFAKRNKAGGSVFDTKAFTRYALPVFVFVLIGAGWWFVREAVLLNGDFLGVKTNNMLRKGIVIPPAEQGISLFELLGMSETYRNLFESVIARYGSLSVRASSRYYTVYWIYLGTGLLVSLTGIRAFSKADGRIRRFHTAILSAVLITILLWVYYIYRIDYQLQGRYIMPAIIPLYYYICRGYDKVFSRLRSARAGNAAAICLVLFVTAALYRYVFGIYVPFYEMLKTLQGG